jgi:hypothetical protein
VGAVLEISLVLGTTLFQMLVGEWKAPPPLENRGNLPLRLFVTGCTPGRVLYRAVPASKSNRGNMEGR